MLIQQQFPDIDIRFVFSNMNTKLYKGSKTYARWCESTASCVRTRSSLMSGSRVAAHRERSMESSLDESEFVGHLPCDHCGSSNGNALLGRTHVLLRLLQPRIRWRSSFGNRSTSRKESHQEGLLKGSYQSLPIQRTERERLREIRLLHFDLQSQPVRSR